MCNRPAGPTQLWLVRHGESQGNLADDRARELGVERLDLQVRDPDVPLSATGEQQADQLGRWLATLPPDERPTAMLSSPFVRAADTARRAARAGGLDLAIRYDERLRERDFGALDGLTARGIRSDHPAEAERRELLGKFWYRPPGGESWADVALRVRSLLATEAQRYDGERLLLVSHQAVVMVVRYVLEELTEQQVLEEDRQVQIANTSVTCYRRADDGAWQLGTFNQVHHLDGRSVTEEPDVPHP